MARAAIIVPSVAGSNRTVVSLVEHFGTPKQTTEGSVPFPKTTGNSRKDALLKSGLERLTIAWEQKAQLPPLAVQNGTAPVAEV